MSAAQPLHNPPGRPREYDPEAALAAALDLFWRQGFEATSLDDLTAAMGISRSSFYAGFGSKRGALLAAVGHYADASFAALRALADAAPSARDAVRAIVAAIADPQGGPSGCFLINCITELAPRDPELAARGRRHLDRVEALIAGHLVAGGLPAPGTDRARALLGLAMGAVLLRKAGTEPPRIRALLTEAETMLT